MLQAVRHLDPIVNQMICELRAGTERMLLTSNGLTGVSDLVQEHFLQGQQAHNELEIHVGLPDDRNIVRGVIQLSYPDPIKASIGGRTNNRKRRNSPPAMLTNVGRRPT